VLLKSQIRGKRQLSVKYARAVAKRQSDPESMAIYKQKASAAYVEHTRRKKEHIAERSMHN
jgi:hypothetical protein